jgi:predicted amidophosphoribosyltransferase
VASVADYALPLASICRTVPGIGEGICDRCHGCPNPGWSTCWSCSQVEGQLSAPCPLVVPISLYEVGHQLHHQLRNYKEAPSDMSWDFLVKTAAILGCFLHLHSGCVAAAANGPWDVITSVPSSTDREGQHPLVRAIKLLPDIRDQYETLLERGEVNITHTIASDQGFNTLRRLDDARVLLIDDTFTSGARAQSAASVLNNAGATVVAILPIGRVITPGFSPSVTAYWKKQGAKVFDFDVCCVGGHGL